MVCEAPFGNLCFCHFSQEWEANIHNCSSSTSKHLPPSIPLSANWLVIRDREIANLCDAPEYLNRIRYLSLPQNKVSNICDGFITAIHNSQKLKWLNLGGNSLTSINSQIKSLDNLEKIWLGDNKFHCDCSMTWMITWLNNFTTPTGDYTIVDYENIKCYSGMMKGTPVYKLNEVKMGCYPKLSTLQKVGMGIGVVVAGFIIILLLVIIIKRSREAKFLMYYYFKLDTVPKDDKDENVDDMEYDAFFCYR